MSIHIITDFNPISKICAVSDEKHTEVFIEGQAGESIKSAIKLIAKLIYSAAEEASKDEDIMKSLDIAEGMTAKDTAVFAITKQVNDDIMKELGSLKVEELLEEHDIPQFLKSIIADSISSKAMEEARKAAEEILNKEEEDEDE